MLTQATTYLKGNIHKNNITNYLLGLFAKFLKFISGVFSNIKSINIIVYTQ